MKPIQFSLQVSTKDIVKKDQILFKPIEETAPIENIKKHKAENRNTDHTNKFEDSQEMGAIMDAIVKEKKQLKICTLCKRKFKNETHYKLHTEKSKLHKKLEHTK